MLFYKIEARLINPGEEPDRRIRLEQTHFIQLKAGAFFVESEYNCHIAISSINYHRKLAVMCAATKKGSLSDDAVREYMKAVDFETEEIDIEEDTFVAYCKLLNMSYRNGYIEDSGEVIEMFGIDKLDARSNHYSDFEYSETVIEPKETKIELLTAAENLLCDSNLKAELERIYMGSQNDAITGHPVHYLLLSDDNDAHDRMLHILLTALYQNGRVKSRRYAEAFYDGKRRLRKDILRALYQSCDAGTVVITYEGGDEEESNYAKIGKDVILDICDIMRRHRGNVLTVFAMKHSAEKVKNLFLENLGTTTIVQVSQETVFDKRARAYLRSRAKENGVSPDRALYKPLKPNTGYNASDLNIIFDEWYDKLLKSKVYTQYSGLETANKQVAEQKPKGSAYSELEEMIGLADAKSVIYQALDFYKAQKLFKSKGFTAERPAMHMVFTGSPGTAKTSVARLFAQIMKDNDLLSVGDLIEVGRSDLVGAYVGWTAQIVKNKFRAAKGSVLFIDEAYSLVDDRDGLYGDEAINTIVQEMENCREDMIVIFAGYPVKMESFLQKNPGLRSRIAFHIPFADYDEDELCRITELMAEKKKLSLATGVREKLTAIYRSAKNGDDFGNGRFARNMFEKAVMRQATRLVAMNPDDVTKEDVTTLLAEDFEMPASAGNKSTRIGFVA